MNRTLFFTPSTNPREILSSDSQYAAIPIQADLALVEGSMHRPAGTVKSFFPSPFQAEDAGSWVAEDASDDLGRLEAGKSVGVMEEAMFSHAVIIPEYFAGEIP
jgi:hypothetical protein